jgi:hypothetical protein
MIIKPHEIKYQKIGKRKVQTRSSRTLIQRSYSKLSGIIFVVVDIMRDLFREGEV